MTVGIFLGRIRQNLDHGIDTKNSNACFESRFQRLDFRYSGLENTALDFVNYFAANQVEAVVL